MAAADPQHDAGASGWRFSSRSGEPRFRIARGLTQAELAGKIGVPQQTITYYEVRSKRALAHMPNRNTGALGGYVKWWSIRIDYRTAVLEDMPRAGAASARKDL